MAREQDEKFALSIKGEGINIERVVDQRTALAVVAAVMGEASAVVPSTQVRAAERPGIKSPASLREFLTETAPKTHNERIVTIGQYIHAFDSKESFSKADIQEGFRRAYERLPKNLNRDLNRTVKAGWIQEAGKRGQYQVTNTGSKNVQEKFGRGQRFAGKSLEE